MNGMIFAAGLGTRLAPLTSTRPKALVEVCGETLLGRAISHLAEAGVDHIVVNVHHFAHLVVDFINANRAKWPADVFISDESDLLLDTGGGLVKALPLFPDDGPIVVGNVDVVCDAPLGLLVDTHVRSHNDATLMTSSRHSTRHLLFDADGLLCGWEDVKNNRRRDVRSARAVYCEAFNGFHVIEQGLVRSFMPEGADPHPLPVISAYLNAASDYRICRSPIPQGC